MIWLKCIGLKILMPPYTVWISYDWETLKAIVRSNKPQLNFTILHLYLCTYYSGWMSCLISFVWALPGCEECQTNENFKMKSQPRVEPATPHFLILRLSPLGHMPSDIEFCLKVLRNPGIWLKSTRGNICWKIIMVICVLELAVR